jgi:hypothetical protein
MCERFPVIAPGSGEIDLLIDVDTCYEQAHFFVGCECVPDEG